MKILVFDIGGTAIKYGICQDGQLEETKECPTEAFKGGPHILNTICCLADQYLPFDAIGISTAGQVNPEEGSIIYANSNIPDYAGTQFRKILQKRFHVPVAVENDVNSAALGEAVFGAGKGRKSFLCLTYGTGVGGAIIESGQVYHGSSFSAGEFGAVITHAEEKLSGIRGEVTDIGWGNQIRSYVMQPYTLVKDTRTGCETSNVNAVMDGALDPFIESYLNCLATGNWVQK